MNNTSIILPRDTCKSPNSIIAHPDTLTLLKHPILRPEATTQPQSHLAFYVKELDNAAVKEYNYLQLPSIDAESRTARPVTNSIVLQRLPTGSKLLQYVEKKFKSTAVALQL